MTYTFTPTETLDDEHDDGTIVANVAELAESVVGRRIVGVALSSDSGRWPRAGRYELRITLDDDRTVLLQPTDDCCAYTELEAFLWNAHSIDNIITGVRTEGGYTKWSIFADAGDVLALTVGWSCGNPFYYGYGFEITVTDLAVSP